MTWTALMPSDWLIHSALGGGLLLLMGWLWTRCLRQPARQQRLGECTLLAALVLAVLALGPAWLELRVPAEFVVAETAGSADKLSVMGAAAGETTATAATSGSRSLAPTTSQQPAHARPDPSFSPSSSVGMATMPVLPVTGTPSVGHTRAGAGESGQISLAPPAQGQTSEAASPAAALGHGLETGPSAANSGLFPSFTLFTWLGIAYVTGALLLLCRWMVGYAGLWRLVRAAEPAPEPMARLFATMAPAGLRPRLLVSSRIRVPL